MKTMKRFLLLFLSVFLVLANLNLSPALATTYRLSLSVRQTPSSTEPVVTLYGQLRPARKAEKVVIQVKTDKRWQPTVLTTSTTSTGTWKIEAVSTALDAKVNYRALVILGSKKIFSVMRTLKISQTPVMSNADPTALISEQGPGGRIHGMDISRWQHPYGATIDFAKMYAAGIRFVMIKAADTKDAADAEALKYLVMDRDAAQAAGIYTGFYYYATLPDATDPTIIVEDAQAQAQKAIWRLASLGGYTDRDLAFALDLENNCVRVSSNGRCAKYAKRDAVTLWATTWLAAVEAKTGRAPIVYSYPQFLEHAMARNADFLQYPLWIAHYSLNPFDPLAQPGQKTAGCFVHSWTTANCSSLWLLWQYTSCGIAQKYGVPGTRVDLDIFRGTPAKFLELMKGIWVPEATDMMPTQEPTQTIVTSVTATDTSKPVVFSVDVLRITGTPVVTGGVKFVRSALNPLPSTVKQSLTRLSSGSWTLSVKGLPAGTTDGRIVFSDISGTHAKSSVPVQFDLLQGATPTPTPTPTPTLTPTPTPTKKPTFNPCRYQVRN